MCSTPLDRLTCLFDTVQLIHAHIRESVTAAFGGNSAVPDDLRASPSDNDLILLIATCIVHARPMHLLATLDYADLFAWSVPIDIM
jgi:hypothetical protein